MSATVTDPPVEITIDDLSTRDLRAIALGELQRRERISKARGGLRFSPETCRRLSEAGVKAWARRKATEAPGDAPVTEGHPSAGSGAEADAA